MFPMICSPCTLHLSPHAPPVIFNQMIMRFDSRWYLQATEREAVLRGELTGLRDQLEAAKQAAIADREKSDVQMAELAVRAPVGLPL